MPFAYIFPRRLDQRGRHGLPPGTYLEPAHMGCLFGNSCGSSLLSWRYCGSAHLHFQPPRGGYVRRHAARYVERYRRNVAGSSFFGIGWGSFKFAYPAYNELIQKAGITIFHCHNLFLNILTETGLAGFITFFTFFFGHFHYGRLQLLKACRESFSYMLAAAVICVVAAISVSGLSDDDLFSTQVSMIFWLISALFCNDYAENAQGRENGLRNYSH